MNNHDDVHPYRPHRSLDVPSIDICEPATPNDYERAVVKSLTLDYITHWTIEFNRQLTLPESRMAVGRAMRDVEHAVMLGMSPARSVAMDWDFALPAVRRDGDETVTLEGK